MRRGAESIVTSVAIHVDQLFYRIPGGIATSSVAFVLALSALVATFLVDKDAAFIALAVYAVALAYFTFYSRHHLVAAAPEEEFAALAEAEAELARD